MEMQHTGSLPTDTEQMDADTILEDPAGGGVLNGLPLLVWEGRLMVLEHVPDAILQGGIDQQANGHDHEERHDPLGLREREGGSPQVGICHAPKAAFCMALTCIAGAQFHGG